MPTLSDIADATGVSASTVFRVLNGQSSSALPDEVKDKIFEMAQKLNYRKQTRRRSIGANNVKKLAIIGMHSEILDANIPFFQKLTNEIEKECAFRGLSANNHQFVWSDAVQSYSQFDDCDKVIVLAGNLEAAEYFHARDQQVVFLAASPDPHRFPSVRVDLPGGTRQALQHLSNLGHDRIGYFGAEAEQADPFSRFSTYESLMNKQHALDESYVHLTGDWTAQSGYAMAKAAITSGRVAPAYFAANDPMAIGAMSAFSDANLRVPQDVAIVGFDNIELSRYTRPPLTTIDDAVDECAKLAIALMIDGLRGTVPLVQLVVPTTLIIRRSCGHPGSPESEHA